MVLVAPSMKPDAPAFEANSLRLKATPALLREAYLGAETHRRGDAGPQTSDHSQVIERSGISPLTSTGLHGLILDGY